MDELSEEDKHDCGQGPKIRAFPVPALLCGGAFTNVPGKYVPLKETIRGFKEILEGKHDDLPEEAFFMVGTIEEAVERAKTLV